VERTSYLCANHESDKTLTDDSQDECLTAQEKDLENEGKKPFHVHDEPIKIQAPSIGMVKAIPKIL